MKNNNTSSGGLGLASVLTIVFIILKLVGVIDWSWIWVLSPIWIDLILTIIVIICIAIYYSHEDKKWERKYGTYTKKKDRRDKWKF